MLLIALLAVLVKTAPDSTPLFESFELATDCIAATERVLAWKDWPMGEKEANALNAKYRKMVDTPVDEMTPEQQRIWKLKRAEYNAEMEAAEKRDKEREKVAAAEFRTKYGRAPDRWEDRSVCPPAIMGELLKGTEMSALERKGGLVKVRVESGRSAGKVGWVSDTHLQK